MFFARSNSALIVTLIALNVVRSAPVLDGSATVDNYVGGDYLKVAPENSNSRESAQLESEGKISSILSSYDDKQNQVGDFLNPKPIIDTISEHEKYGNNGDHFYGIGRAIVNGFESFANFMNRILNAPGEATSSISKRITTHLDKLGGKIVGLA